MRTPTERLIAEALIEVGAQPGPNFELFVDTFTKRLEALERVAEAVREWQAVDDMNLELEMYALERSEHELRIIAALEALDKLCETK